jgi:hypothetical protein
MVKFVQQLPHIVLTMTKVIKNSSEKNMHSHKFKNLPSNYCKKTQKILQESGITFSDSTIRDVKTGRRNNNVVLQALLKVEYENKKLLEEIEELKEKNI